MIDRLLARWWVAPSLVLAAAAATMLPWIGSYPLLPEWEPHYGQVVREMLARGNWLDPMYRGQPFFDKPILPFWMELVSFSLLGETELAVRLPMALSGIAGVLAFYFLVARIYNRRIGLVGGLMLATTPFYYLVARQFMFDMPYVALQTASLLCLVIGGIPRPDGAPEPKRRAFLAAFWVMTGLALMTKGLLAIAVPGAIGLVYILITFDFKVLQRIEPWWGIPLTIVVGCPWYAWMTHEHGVDFLREFIVRHHFDRLTGDLDKPTGTFEFYVREVGVGLMPWVTLLPIGLAHAFGDFKLKLDQPRWRDAFLRLAFLAPFVFYTLSTTKFPHYVLPSVPFLVLMMACGIDGQLADREARTSRLLWVLAAVFLGLVAKDLLEGRGYKLVFYLFTTHRLQDFHPLVANPHLGFSIIFGLIGFVVLWVLIRRRLSWPAFGAMLALTMSYAFYLNGWMVPGLCNMFSARGLVELYMRERSPGDPFADFGTWKTRAMTFYLPLDSPLERIRSLPSFRALQNRHPGRRLFIAVLERDLGQLRQIARQADEEVYIIGDDGWEDYREILLVSTSRGRTGDPRREAVVSSRPEPRFRSDATFDSRIRLLGADVSPEVVGPDDTVTVTYYFEATAPIQRDAQIFTHVESTVGETRFVQDHHPVSAHFPTSMWRQGDIVRDSFVLTVPTHAEPGPYRLMMGFFLNDDRWGVTPARAGDGENRVEAGRFTVR